MHPRRPRNPAAWKRWVEQQLQVERVDNMRQWIFLSRIDVAVPWDHEQTELPNGGTTTTTTSTSSTSTTSTTSTSTTSTSTTTADPCTLESCTKMVLYNSTTREHEWITIEDTCSDGGGGCGCPDFGDPDEYAAFHVETRECEN